MLPLSTEDLSTSFQGSLPWLLAPAQKNPYPPSPPKKKATHNEKHKELFSRYEFEIVSRISTRLKIPHFISSNEVKPFKRHS